MFAKVYWFNSLPKENIYGLTKLKAFANDKFNVAKMIISLFNSVENIVGIGENLVTSISSFSLYVFKRLLYTGLFN